MAKASTQDNTDFVKFLYVGDSGTGKTGSLLSLIEAGYDIKMLDMDNGVEPLVKLIQHKCPERIDQLDYISLRDHFQADPVRGIRVKGTPKAYTTAIKYLNKWDDDSVPAEWGDNTIFVLDTLGAFGRSAFLWAQGMNPGSKDPRQWYGAAQESIRTVLELLTSAEFRAHVIVISHVQLIEVDEGVYRGQVSAIGKALGGDIPKVFNTWLQAASRGTGDKIRRTIQTTPNPLLDLKTPIPWELEKSLPLETGLATVFEKLRGK
jgi:hypothetical protein